MNEVSEKVGQPLRKKEFEAALENDAMIYSNIKKAHSKISFLA